MNSTMDNVLHSALALSSGDRIELVEAIVASLRPEDRPPFDESWREVIRRRSAEMQSSAVQGVPWNEVKARSRGQAGG